MQKLKISAQGGSASGGKIQNAGGNVRRGGHCFHNFVFSKQSGFSLIETVIAVAVIGILAALALNGLFSFRASGELFRAADLAVGALKDARSRTLASQNNSQYGVFFDQNQNQVVLFSGGFYVASAPANEIIKLPGQIKISSVSLTGATTSIAFARLSGDPNATGTVALQISGITNPTKTIQINGSGSVEIKP